MVTTSAEPSDIDLCLLGPLRVLVDGRAVSIGGPRQMAVLARLMLTPGQAVSMDQLVDSVWANESPSQPHTAIRSYVSNLRRAIEPTRRRRATDSCLVSSPPGYRLAIDQNAVDWIRFQALIEEARSGLVQGDHVAASTSSRNALSLWRGDACAGLPDSPVFVAHRQRLATLRRTATELLFESLLEGGDHDIVAAEIEAAIVDDPLQERLVEIGMLAFYRSGHQSQALGLSRRLREALRDDLGVDPSPGITDLELKILNHDRSLDLQGPSEGVDRSTGAIATSSGEPPALPPPGHLAETARSGPTRHLVGRDRELAVLGQVAAGVIDGRSGKVALVGEQGIGKTTLLRTWIDDLASQGIPTLSGHSVADGGRSLWPWTQIVLAILEERYQSTSVDWSSMSGLDPLANLGPTVAAVLARQPPETVSEAETMLAVTRLLAHRADIGPFAIVLEDLHWADRATIKLIDFAAAALEQAPVLIALTWRDTERGASVLRGLGRLNDLRRLDLGSLDDAAVVELGRRNDAPLTLDEARALRRRTSGNPMFLRELLTSRAQATDRFSPALHDVVIDRVERVDRVAVPILRDAALFRTSFTAEDLEPVHKAGLATVERVLVEATTCGLLDEADATLGTYRFRHPIVAEVLEADTSSTELRTGHRTIGAQLLRTDRSEASYHLARSPDPGDRALAARISLDSFHRGGGSLPWEELDQRVRSGLTAVETLGRNRNLSYWEDLVTDALGFFSWRARVEDRPMDWYENARRCLRAAIEGIGSGTGSGSPGPTRSQSIPLRGVDREPLPDQPLDRLERSVLNMIGLPPVPAGAGDPNDFTVTAGPVLDDLALAIEHLPQDRPARAAVRVHLHGVELATQRNVAGRTRAGREAKRLVNGARRRLDGAGLGLVLVSYLARFGSVIEPDEVESLLDEYLDCSPGPTGDLLWARHGYPVLLSRGRIDAATRRVEAALTSTEVDGGPLLRAEARLLWTRHLLWIGELGQAARSIDETSSELTAIGLPDPLPLVRQRRVLRFLNGEPIDPPSVEADGTTIGQVTALTLADRASPAELAFRLASVGQFDRVGEHLDQMIDRADCGLADLTDIALLGGAAQLFGHREAAESFGRHLEAHADRLLVRPDGSAVFGPAGLWAAMVAKGAGRGKEARRLFHRSMTVLGRAGGSSCSVRTVANNLDVSLPIDFQSNLNPAAP